MGYFVIWIFMYFLCWSAWEGFHNSRSNSDNESDRNINGEKLGCVLVSAIFSYLIISIVQGTQSL